MCLRRFGFDISRSEVIVDKESWLETFKAYSLLGVVDFDKSYIVLDF